MAQKEKRFTQTQVAHKLGIQAYMVGAWEKQFGIEAQLFNGEKLYTKKDLSTFKSIKELLYEKGFSMDAAKKYLYDQPDLEGTTLKAASPLLFQASQPIKKPGPRTSLLDKRVEQKLLGVKEQLIKLRNALDG